MMLRASLLSAVFVLAGAAPSDAALIDFTDRAAWSLAEGADDDPGFTSGTTYDGVSVRVTSNGPATLLTFNAGDVNPTCAAVTGLACDGDGLGINDDEITYGDIFQGTADSIFVYFSAPVNVASVGFLDLFGVTGGDTQAETAKWLALLTDFSIVEGFVVGTDTGNLGYKTAAPNLSNVLAMRFFTANSITTPDPAANSDFALAAIEITPIPEPATLILTGAGLAAAFRARRRR
jgi:hypothetical protein